MKEAILLLIVLLLPAIASAETITLFSGTVEPFNNYQTSENQPLNVSILEDQAKVVVRIPQLSMTASNNSCSFNGYFKFCANDISFSRYNYSLPSRMAYKVSITLTTELGEVILNRTISPTTLYAGQQANATIEIRNTGMVDTYNLTYTDNLSNLVDVFPLAVSECEFEGGLFKWSGNLPGGRFLRCYALLQGRTAGTESAVAYLYYTTRGVRKSGSSSISITVKENPLKINYTGNMLVGVGENTTLYFNISTTENLTLGSFSISIPKNILVLGSSGIQKVSDKEFFLMSDFSAGDSKAFELTLRPMASGALQIKINYKVFFANMIQSYSVTPEIIGVISELQPSVPTTSFTEGDAELNVLINNPTNYSFKNITVQAGSPVSQKASLSDVEAYGHRTVQLPFAAAEGTSNLTIKVTYYSVYKEKFEKTLYAEIKVSKPAETTQTPEPEQQQQANTEYQPDSSEKKFSTNAKYVALAAVAFVIGAIVFWVIRRRHQDMLLGA
ncbi:MAG: hypothetical protein V1702_00135 [Candidatus Woesearchaeota archaeon]